MINKKFVLSIHVVLFLLLMSACGNKVDKEIEVLFDAVMQVHSKPAMMEMLDALAEEKPYEDKIAPAINENNNAIKTLRAVELSTKEVEKLRSTYISGIGDLQKITEILEANKTSLSDDNLEKIGTLIESSNEKQMELLQEVFKRLDLPEDLK